MRVRGMVLVLFSLMTHAAFACDPSFKLVNDAPWTVLSVYTRGAGEDGWSQEQLGKDQVLTSGYERSFSFRSSNVTQYDVQLVFRINDQNSRFTWTGVPLCSISQMVVYYARSQGGFKATWD